jgi:hypothetical protein
MAASAVLAAHDVPTEGCRAATLDGTHHLQLVKADMAAVGLTPSGTMLAEDIRDLQGRTGHCRGSAPVAGPGL